MTTIQLDLHEDLVTHLRELDRPVERAALELIVLELYRRGTISSGKAAEVLGIDRFDFIRQASALGIPFFKYTEEEWQEEMRVVDELVAARRSSATPAR